MAEADGESAVLGWNMSHRLHDYKTEIPMHVLGHLKSTLTRNEGLALVTVGFEGLFHVS